MRARLLKGFLAILLVVAGGLVAPTLVAPHAAQARQPAQAPRDDQATLTATPAMSGTVTPGPTTPPPLVQITSSYTTTCDTSVVSVILRLTNVSAQATPSDSTLVVNLPSGYRVLYTSGGSLMGSTLTVPFGVLGPGSSMSLNLTFQPLAISGHTQLLVLTASVSEAGAGSTGEVLSNVYVAQIPLTPTCAAPTFPPAQTPTSTPPPPTATSVPSATSTAVPPTQVPPTQVPPTQPPPTLSAPPPTNTPVPPTPTSTVATGAGAPPTSTRTPSAPISAGLPPSGTNTPTSAAILATATPVVKVVTHYKTVTRYKTITRTATPVVKVVTHYKTVTRYKTVTKTVTRYKTVPRYHTITLYKTKFHTVVTYRTVVRQQVHQVVKTVVNHKTVVHMVTKVLYKTVVRHKTVTSVVKAVRVIRHPTTGRFAAPLTPTRYGAMPSPDAYMSLPRLGIAYTPVWTRGYKDDGYGGFTYDIVPYTGVTRFSYSVPFGQPGLSMVYGHDDIYGSIFQYLGRMRRGDTVEVAMGSHRYTYVVRSVRVVLPTDVSMLTAPRAVPTLALISCTPFMVDTHRVVVIAELKQ